jgi:hypothetical protein
MRSIAMLNQLVLDLAFGLMILGLFRLFHRVTLGMLTPTVDFQQYSLDLIRELFANPVLLLGYLISLGIHSFLAGITITTRCFLFSTPVKLLDVVLICIFTPLILSISYLIESQTRYFSLRNREPEMTEIAKILMAYEENYLSAVFKSLRGAFVSYFPFAIVLLIGGLFGWFVSSSLLNQQ